MIIGITGGTGCGKTTLLKAIEARGGLVLDCDAIYHELLRSDKEMLAAIDVRFPGVIEDGALNRKKLGAIVFTEGCNPLSYGLEADVNTLSAGLFAALRELDDPSIHQVYARCPVGGGVAYAVQNRLKKAAAFHIVDAEEEA